MRALGQFLGALRKLLPMLGDLTLKGVILTLQIGKLMLQIRNLMLKCVMCSLLLTDVRRWRPLRFVLRNLPPVICDQTLQLAVLLAQIGN